MRLLLSFLTLLTLASLVPDAAANRRAIRVDGFGTWSTFDEPTLNCPGWSNGSTLLLGPGYVFSGRDNPAHLTDTYCQVPTPGTLNQQEFFYPDETSLASMLGDNAGDRVTAKRYSLLDQPRFSGDATGFQWVFYYFPSGGVILSLHGLEDTILTNTSYISQNGTRLWDAARDGFDGQYFCFEGLTYVGTWDGLLPSSSSCVRIGFRVFRGSFD